MRLKGGSRRAFVCRNDKATDFLADVIVHEPV